MRVHTQRHATQTATLRRGLHICTQRLTGEYTHRLMRQMLARLNHQTHPPIDKQTHNNLSLLTTTPHNQGFLFF
ncbi:hypothetical protein F4Z99_04050 [Candidatus Poribacteria bacterium]|nr:hypothetical protein [Candidatus Poribacteria bacterium]